MWFPLLILPLLIYNAVAFDLVGTQGLAWAAPVTTVPMASGAVWTVSVGDLLVIVALLLLLIETLRAPHRTGWISGVLASSVVFAAYLGEFLIVPAASTSLFFTCTAMSLADLIVRMFMTRSAPPSHDFNY